MSKHRLLIWGGALLICAALAIFVLYPGIKLDLETLKSTKNSQQELNQTAQAKNIFTQLSKNNDLARLQEIATNYIPTDSQSSNLILELTAMANQAGTNIDQLSLVSKAEAAKPNDTNSKSSNGESNLLLADEVGFQITISGNFNNFLQFLRLTETSSRLIAIQSINMNQGKDNFTAQVSGKGYYKKEIAKISGLAEMTISQETITKLQNLRSYANPLNTQNEAGFGRTNPFEAIQ